MTVRRTLLGALFFMFVALYLPPLTNYENFLTQREIGE